MFFCFHGSPETSLQFVHRHQVGTDHSLRSPHSTLDFLSPAEVLRGLNVTVGVGRGLQEDQEQVEVVDSYRDLEFTWTGDNRRQDRVLGSFNLCLLQQTFSLVTYLLSIWMISSSFLYHLIFESLRTLKNRHHSFKCPEAPEKVSLRILRIT